MSNGLMILHEDIAYMIHTYERGNPVQSYVCFLFLRNLKQGRRTGACVTTGFQNYTIVLYIARRRDICRYAK
jgi:hypothetical protein